MKITKKDFVCKCVINSPETPVEKLEALYTELQEKGYIDKNKAKNEMIKKLNLPELFNEKILKDQEYLIKLKELNMTADFFKTEMNKFLSYRTEKGENQLKERWEKEKVFDIKKRFVTWLGNNKNKIQKQEVSRITLV